MSFFPFPWKTSKSVLYKYSLYSLQCFVFTLCNSFACFLRARTVMRKRCGFLHLFLCWSMHIIFRQCHSLFFHVMAVLRTPSGANIWVDWCGVDGVLKWRDNDLKQSAKMIRGTIGSAFYLIHRKVIIFQVSITCNNQKEISQKNRRWKLREIQVHFPYHLLIKLALHKNGDHRYLNKLGRRKFHKISMRKTTWPLEQRIVVRFSNHCHC